MAPAISSLLRLSSGSGKGRSEQHLGEEIQPHLQSFFSTDSETVTPVPSRLAFEAAPTNSMARSSSAPCVWPFPE